MTTERIAAAIKPILDEDRRADRVRIAELERDLAAANVKKEWLDRRCDQQAVELCDFSDQLDELTEKCAALVVENKRLHGDNNRLNKSLGVNDPFVGMTGPIVEMRQTIKDLKAQLERQPLRIDTDMSDPQPGKLLVVRLQESDADYVRGSYTFEVDPHQFVGFLVETPAVEVKRTPKVGDRVRFAADSNHPGIMGVVSHDLGDGAMLVSQGESASHNRPNFVAMPTEIEVIE